MARRLVLLALIVASAAVLFILQRHHITAPVTPRPLLYLVADAERSAGRVPLSLTRVSDQEESQIGEELSRNICREPRVSTPPSAYRPPLALGSIQQREDARIRAYLNEVGQRVAQHVERRAISYHFCFDDNAYLVNAYAIPGGYIVVGRGLLELLESEDELAAILGHEITHVDRRHAIERMQYKIASQKAGVGSLYQLGAPAQWLYEAGYTKDQELEADRNGLDLAVAAGYSPLGGINVMQHFEKMEQAQRDRTAGSPITEFAGIPLQSIQEYFRSHPPAYERLAAMQAEIRSRGWALSPVRPYALRAIFLVQAAHVLDMQGKFDESIAKYQEALRLEPDNVAASDGLASVEWRTGDAAAAEKAALQASPQMPTLQNIRILARSGAVANPDDAAATLSKIADQRTPDRLAMSQLARVELAGLIPGNFSYGPADYRKVIEEVSTSPAWESTLRAEMAWWMYRGEKLKEAAAELEAARQKYPQSGETAYWKAWVDSDLGHQADAQQDLIARDRAFQSPVPGDALAALRAVILWRSGDLADAKTDFAQAARADPAWMVPKWVENNFSHSSSLTIEKLIAAESARRAGINGRP
jgi:predicted Zn-dependent protease